MPSLPITRGGVGLRCSPRCLALASWACFTSPRSLAALDTGGAAAARPPACTARPPLPHLLLLALHLFPADSPSHKRAPHHPHSTSSRPSSGHVPPDPLLRDRARRPARVHPPAPARPPHDGLPLPLLNRGRRPLVARLVGRRLCRVGRVLCARRAHQGGGDRDGALEALPGLLGGRSRGDAGAA